MRSTIRARGARLWAPSRQPSNTGFQLTPVALRHSRPRSRRQAYGSGPAVRRRAGCHGLNLNHLRVRTGRHRAQPLRSGPELAGETQQ
jgi:hypothetical protein